MFATRPKTTTTAIILSLLFFIACTKNSDSGATAPPVDPVSLVLNLPALPFNYANPTLPAYITASPIQAQINTPINNQITDNGATLGRVLFYDKNLSINNSTSCASCHKQANAFSDTELKSEGFNGGLTGRHSMPLTNVKYYPNGRFFWDQRAATLEEQVLTPIQDAVEMGMTLLFTFYKSIWRCDYKQ